MNMSLNLIYDEIHKLHVDPYGRHPENPWRFENTIQALKNSRIWEKVKLYGTPEGEKEILRTIHSKSYISYIENECKRGFHYIDTDTYVTEHTFNVATRFITATYNATLKSIENGEPWIIMPRPAGHHAGINGAALGAPTLGFCIFNYAAAAAKALLERNMKVLIIDFDVHHGNGTQEILWKEPKAVHIDIHQWGIYPGTGDINDIGGSGAEGTKINIPLPSGSGDQEYLWITENVIQPLIETFKPDAIIVSAGFDAYIGDPLATLNVTEETYIAIAQTIVNAIENKMTKTVVTIVEGGYGEGLKIGLTTYLETIIKTRRYSEILKPKQPPTYITQKLQQILKDYWNIN